MYKDGFFDGIIFWLLWDQLCIQRMHTWCIHDAHIMHIWWIHDAYMMYTWCIYGAYMMYTWCIGCTGCTGWSPSEWPVFVNFRQSKSAVKLFGRENEWLEKMLFLRVQFKYFFLMKLFWRRIWWKKARTERVKFCRWGICPPIGQPPPPRRQNFAQSVF